ncbi:two-component regulator propeller domain-containing protein [Carboxylicivirga sp. RSCT41]|uniref:type IX secretion system anionic LPS delivery protein PorZ n=1 Tax=Carboxylicivirga agarovorans TaxID=3417570 RepID=UPI003D3582D8
MIRLITILFLFCICYITLDAQVWKNHQAMNSATSIASSESRVVVGTSSGIYIYSFQSNEMITLNKALPLNDEKVTSVAYADEFDYFIIGYSTGNIDLLIDDSIYNVPELSLYPSSGSKQINDILVNGLYAYLSSDLGLIRFDLEKQEIYEVYPIVDQNVLSLNEAVIFNDKIYVASDDGVFYADEFHHNLIDSKSWKQLVLPETKSNSYNTIENIGDNYFLVNCQLTNGKDATFKVNDSGYEIFETNITDIANIVSNESVYVIGDSKLQVFDQDLNLKDTIVTYVTETGIIENIYPFDITVSDGYSFICDNNYGLIWKNDIDKVIMPDRPEANFNIHMYYDERLIVSTGSFDGKTDIPAHWYFYSESWNTTKTESKVYDVIKTTVDKDNKSKIYGASWGYGLIEFGNEEIVYNESNSPLRKFDDYLIWVGGPAMDSENNLWMTNSLVDRPIHVKLAEKSLDENNKNAEYPGWLTLDYPGIVTNINGGEGNFLPDIFVDSRDYKWINVSNNGLFVFDTNNTLFDFQDDQYRGPLNNYVDKDSRNKGQLMLWDENRTVITKVVTCIVEDKNGYIWLGTDVGVLLYYRPWAIFSEQYPVASRIKVPRNDGSNLADYLLDGERVTCIAVDGANRKWIGTANSGIYLVSEDGLKTYNTFNVDNSPLPSNSITSIAISPNSGEVFIGTENGIVSYRAKATEGDSSFKKVYAYPNPVRPDYSGEITITGLMQNSIVKITTVSGKLVHETTSLGGNAYWDGTNFSGEKVKTGVYLIYVSSSDGTDSDVIKLLIVR